MRRWNKILDHTFTKIHDYGGQIRGYHKLDNYSIQFFIRGGTIGFLSVIIEIDMSEEEINNVLMTSIHQRARMAAA